MRLSRTTAAELLPLDLDAVRRQCRIPDDLHDDDGLLAALIPTAVDAFENYANRGLLTQTWTLGLDDWFNVVDLPMAAPLQSVTSVKYRAGDGTLTTIASSYYLTDTIAEPGRITRAPNVAWPALQADRLNGRIEIAYVVGYTTAAAIPAAITQGQLLLIAEWYWNRSISGDVPSVVQALWAPFRVWTRPVVCV